MTPAHLGAALAVLREALRAAGYDQDALKRTLGINYPDDIGILNRVPAILRLRDDRSELARAVRLFFLEADETAADATKLLSRAGVEVLARVGLLQQRGGRVRTRLRVDPIGDRLLLADRRFRDVDRAALSLSRAAGHPSLGGMTGTDPVYPPSADSIILREAVVAVAGGSGLDLCTGSGVQALAQAAVAADITAVDINPRAVAVARLNARLNAASNVDVQLGNLYAGVPRRRFDTIIANPPFVSSPHAHGPSYHAGGATGDELLRRVIRGFATHLRPSGRAFAISHVGLRAGQELADIGRRWFRTFRGRAAVFELESGTAVDLAAAQSLFAIEHGLSAYENEVRRWVEYLERHRIARIAAILIVAENTGVPGFELVDARQRILPLPLSPPLPQRVTDWLAQR